MASSLTVTGKVGPGLTVTSQLLSNVVAFGVDIVNGVLTVNQTDNPLYKIDISAATTFTVTISGGNYTVTIS